MSEPVRLFTAEEPPPAIAVRGLVAPTLTAAQIVGRLPQEVDLILYRGDDFFLDITVTDSGGMPIDLTGSTAAAQFRNTTEDPNALASFSATVAGNIVHLHLLASDAALLVPECVWDIQVTDSAGVVTTLAFGAATVTSDVTRLGL